MEIRTAPTYGEALLNSGMTNGKGEYVVRGLAPGGYGIGAQAKGFRSLAKPLPPQAGLSWEVTLVLAPGSALVTQGRWVNERDGRAVGDNTAQGPLAIDGGTVTLGAAGDLDVQSGSLIDVGGGGQVTSKGALVEGKGGTVDLSTDDTLATHFNVAGTRHEPLDRACGGNPDHSRGRRG